MRLLTGTLLLALELGGVFGQASAEVVSIDEQAMTVELTVGVEGEVDAVIAHLALPAEPEIALPLLDRGDGSYGITTEVKPADYQVVFETLGEVSSQSQPVALTDLGVDLGGAGGPSATTDEGLSTATQGWGWLALAFGAASLAALAFWVLGGRDEEEAESEAEPHEPDQSGEVQPVDSSSPDS